MKTLHINIAGFRPGLEPNLLAAGFTKSMQDTAEFGATEADLTLEGGAHSSLLFQLPRRGPDILLTAVMGTQPSRQLSRAWQLASGA